MESTYPVLPEKLLLISLKMYFTPDRTLSYLNALLNPTNEIVHPQHRQKLLLALIPDFLTIHPCAEIIKSYEQTLQTQNIPTNPPPSSSARKTVSGNLQGPTQAKSIFNETDAQTAAKAAATCAQGMVPLVCIGEITAPGAVASEAVGKAVDECAVLVRAVLDAVPVDAPVIFAYEPVWAIGQPKPAGVDHVAAVVSGIRGAGPGLWSRGGLGEAVDGMFLGRFAHEIGGVREVVREVEESLGL
ncbi:hypothetical protein N7522_002400 [Penicillium canescens]|nr:hypothetical protein N7522_002400 [Penicillium canescens]